MTSETDEATVLGGHRTLAAAAAEEIRRRILSGRYAGGTRLHQASLSREIGISRIPLREALVQLDAEGLVKIVPHHGALVADLSVPEIEELFALRAQLEPRLLQASGPKLTATDFAALEKILSEYSSELRKYHVIRWGELNTALHSLLYKRADLPRTAAIVASLLRNTERHTCMQLAYTDGLQRAETEHANIVALCRNGAFDEACAMLDEHISNTATTLVAYINSKSTSLTALETATLGVNEHPFIGCARLGPSERFHIGSVGFQKVLVDRDAEAGSIGNRERAVGGDPVQAVAVGIAVNAGRKSRNARGDECQFVVVGVSDGRHALALSRAGTMNFHIQSKCLGHVGYLHDAGDAEIEIGVGAHEIRSAVQDERDLEFQRVDVLGHQQRCADQRPQFAMGLDRQPAVSERVLQPEEARFIARSPNPHRVGESAQLARRIQHERAHLAVHGLAHVEHILRLFN